MQWDYQEQVYVTVKYIPSADMVADGMTKAARESR